MRLARLTPLLLAGAALAACAAPDGLAPEQRAPALAIAPPPNQAASGVAIDGAPLGRPGMTAWDGWTSQVGRRNQYIMWFTDWSTNFQGFAVTNAYSKGAVPVITWEMKNRSTAITYNDVLGGKWNAYIDKWAQAAKADGRPVFVRFMHEMNGNWYGWSGASNGASAAAAQNAVATWRYVHDRFVAAGATNVTWVWCPNAESVPAATWNTYEAYYPGDAYVDWVGADGYNWGTSQTLAANGWDSHWQTFDEIFATAYQRITTLAPTKPFMIGEFASTEVGGSKAAWITDAAARLSSSSYANVRGFVWFNYNKETDWRVESSAASLAAFKSAFVNGPRFAWQ